MWRTIFTRTFWSAWLCGLLGATCLHRAVAADLMRDRIEMVVCGLAFVVIGLFIHRLWDSCRTEKPDV